jgi:hypothetical protein
MDIFPVIIVIASVMRLRDGYKYFSTFTPAPRNRAHGSGVPNIYEKGVQLPPE